MKKPALVRHIDDCQGFVREFDEEGKDPHDEDKRLNIETNCLLIPHIQEIGVSSNIKNPRLDFGLDTWESFGRLFRALFQPSRPLAELLKAHLLGYFKGAWVLGLQIRIEVLEKDTMVAPAAFKEHHQERALR